MRSCRIRDLLGHTPQKLFTESAAVKSQLDIYRHEITPSRQKSRHRLRDSTQSVPGSLDDLRPRVAAAQFEILISPPQ